MVPVMMVPPAAVPGTDAFAAPPSHGPSPESQAEEVQPAVGATSCGPRPAPQTLARAQSQGSGCSRIWWHVDARKLKTSDKQAVSPPFALPMNVGDGSQECTYKMMLSPMVASGAHGKGASSFKKAKGWATVHLKCENDTIREMGAELAFRIAVGSERARGPMHHNFARSSVCGLPPHLEAWNLGSHVDESSRIFSVCLEVVSTEGMRDIVLEAS